MVLSCASQWVMFRVSPATLLYTLGAGLVEVLLPGIGYGLALWQAA